MNFYKLYCQFYFVVILIQFMYIYIKKTKKKNTQDSQHNILKYFRPVHTIYTRYITGFRSESHKNIALKKVPFMISRYNGITHVWIIDKYVHMYYVKVLRLKVKWIEKLIFFSETEKTPNKSWIFECLLHPHWSPSTVEPSSEHAPSTGF